MKKNRARLARTVAFWEKALRQEKPTELNAAFLKQETWREIAPNVYACKLERENPFLASMNQREFSRYKLESAYGKYRLKDALFFDTETTGLSGGAGNMIFLIGLAWFESCKLMVEQVFLNDFPGEPEFMAYIHPFFNRDKVLLSYNGKGFDSHILNSRFLLNGITQDFTPQLDLLFLARRFWKRIVPACSLSCIEAQILQIYRKNDIPGYEVPEAYLNYLNYQDDGLLGKVIDHNRQDIVSLVELLKLIEMLLSRGKLSVPFDLTALGQFLLYSQPQRSLKYLEQSLKQGDLKAGNVLGEYYKRRRMWDKALAVWTKLAAKKVVYGYCELAKYYEHREKDFELALYWTRCLEKNLGLLAGTGLSRNFTVQTQKRKNRLLKRLKKRP